MRFLLILALLLAGCAHQAKHIEAPDSAPVIVANRKLAADVAATREAVKQASASVEKARVAVKEANNSHEAEAGELAVIAPKVEELLRLAPVELRPLVQAVQSDVETLRGEQASTASKIEDAYEAINAANHSAYVADAKATAAVNDSAESRKVDDVYIAGAEATAVEANEAQQGWAKDSAQIVKMKEQSWLYRIAAGLGLLAIGAVIFLHFTGRLALTAGAVASKFP